MHPLFIAVTYISVHYMVVSAGNRGVFRSKHERKLDDHINHLLRCRHVPGVTISIIKGNSTWTKSYGYADIYERRKVQPSTVFCIGSLTKAFTSTLIAMGINEARKRGRTFGGKMPTLTSRISDILGADVSFTDDVRSRVMTIKDVLTHRTGLASHDLGVQAGYFKNVTRSDLIRRLKYLPEKETFRDGFIYNNYLYMLAGSVAEVLFGGRKYEDLVREKIFQPLGMTSSRFAEDFNKANTNFAVPYNYDRSTGHYIPIDTALFDIGPIDPAGGICSNAIDMGKWITFLLNKGTTRSGRRLLSSFWFDVLMNQYVTIDPLRQYFGNLQRPAFPVADITEGYAMGWFSSHYRGFKRIDHTGDMFGHSSLIWLFPELDIGIYINLNGPSPYYGSPGWALRAISYLLADNLLGETPWVNRTTMCTIPVPWTSFHLPSKSMQLPSPLLPADHDNFTGKYGNGLLGDFYVYVSNNGESLRGHLGKHLFGRIHPAQERKNTFYLFLEGALTHVARKKMEISFHRSNRSLDVDRMSISPSVFETIHFYKNESFYQTETVKALQLLNSLSSSSKPVIPCTVLYILYCFICLYTSTKLYH